MFRETRMWHFLEAWFYCWPVETGTASFIVVFSLLSVIESEAGNLLIDFNPIATSSTIIIHLFSDVSPISLTHCWLLYLPFIDITPVRINFSPSWIFNCISVGFSISVCLNNCSNSCYNITHTAELGSNCTDVVLQFISFMSHIAGIRLLFIILIPRLSNSIHLFKSHPSSVMGNL